MRINADFSRRIVIRPEDYRWVDSPTPGVERMMLDRIGGEVARATSLVRYAPESDFPAHVHGGGEEIFVISGEFADDHGRYPAGSYVRNPVGTSHAPSVGPGGATIFVKLHQFDPADREQKVIDTTTAEWLPGPATGTELVPLHRFDNERVYLLRLMPSACLRIDGDGGAEVLVLRGTLREDGDTFPAGTWIRVPHEQQVSLCASGDGAVAWMKSGHLDPGTGG